MDMDGVVPMLVLSSKVSLRRWLGLCQPGHVSPVYFPYCEGHCGKHSEAHSASRFAGEDHGR